MLLDIVLYNEKTNGSGETTKDLICRDSQKNIILVPIKATHELFDKVTKESTKLDVAKYLHSKLFQPVDYTSYQIARFK